MKSIIVCTLTFLGICCGSAEAAPKVVVKFGTPECPWSEQFKKDVWNSSTFQALLDGAGIEKEVQEASIQDENLPSLALFTDNGEEIGSLGYLLISPEKYVDLLKEMMTIHTLCQSLEPLGPQQLLQLYRKAQVLHMTTSAEKLLLEGLAKDKGVDFLIEHYAHIVKEHPRRAQKIKQEIRSRKPDDRSTEWELALISFQARLQAQQEVSKVVLPLEKFLRDFGSTDSEYAWRCHLVLAEFYRDKNLLEKARHHAKLAAEGAPVELKGMIITIGNGDT